MSKPLMLTELELDVRPLSQHILHPVALPDTNRACWYVAALMVLGYRGMLQTRDMDNARSLARKQRNRGIMPADLWQLADEAGMEHAPAKALLPRMGAANWREALAAMGPLMVAVGMHMVVVRGVVRQGDDWAIVYNDPYVGARRTMVLLRFNSIVEWGLPILYRRSAYRAPMVLRQPVEEPYRIGY